MFRLSLRRCLRTSNAFSSATRVTLGASAVTAAYMTWRLTNQANQIALDSEFSEPPRQKPTQSPLQVPSTPDEDIITPPEESEPPTAENDADESSGAGAASGAFNPETGEINWDCPCLGGMAHGPCGPEFREAFSCFVYSEAEPKGINCVDKFQNMQNCFRAHPEVYADEIMNDDDDDEAPANPGNSDVPPAEDSGDVQLDGDATPGLEAPQKPQLDGAHAARDSPETLS